MTSSRLALLVLVVALAGCKREAPAPPAALANREETRQGVRFLELFLHGADETSPLLVGIHGRGANPDDFAGLFTDYPGRLEVVLPQASLPFGDGWSWFDWRRETTDDGVAARVGEAEERLWPAILELAHGRRVLVTGFSQGGMLSYVLAARHPAEIAAAFPISGFAPKKLLPAAGAKAAPVFAMHGTADEMIEFSWAQETLAGFQRAGASIELQAYPGVGHTVTREMRGELFARIRAATSPVDAGR